MTASDTAAGEVPIYTLSGPDADAFDIDAATGQLRTRAVLDRDAKDTHTVTVSVHDGFDATYNPSPTTDHTIEVTIVVSVSSRPLAPRGGGAGGGGGGGGGGRGPAPDKRGEFGDITGHQFVNEIRWIAEQGHHRGLLARAPPVLPQQAHHTSPDGQPPCTRPRRRSPPTARRVH